MTKIGDSREPSGGSGWRDRVWENNSAYSGNHSFYASNNVRSYLFYFDLLFSKMRQHFRCYLLFGFIGRFGLLKDINISFFLSMLHNNGDEIMILYWVTTIFSDAS